MCKVSIHSNGSNHDKKSGSSSQQVNSFYHPVGSSGVTFSHAQYSNPIFCRAKQGVEDMYTLGLCTTYPGVYINGVVHFYMPLACTGIQGRIRMLHRKSWLVVNFWFKVLQWLSTSILYCKKFSQNICSTHDKMFSRKTLKQKLKTNQNFLNFR